MTEEVIGKLSAKLRKYICTLKKASMDTENDTPMCESLIKVVNFDKIPNEYSRGKGWDGVPKSNDALYLDVQGKWYFIEFKNGTIQKGDLYRKLYDSLIMLLEWRIIPDLDFVRKNIHYILVYNGSNYGKIQQSQARDKNYGYVWERAEQEERLFDIDKFENYLFHETHTYTKSLFEKNFVQPKEKEEEKWQLYRK
ncbi:MAG: hypothetical protein HFG80_14530 [Eubacterium sp.]|nr:hypothetical protein [Eubacterium sp.]